MSARDSGAPLSCLSARTSAQQLLGERTQFDVAFLGSPSRSKSKAASGPVHRRRTSARLLVVRSWLGFGGDSLVRYWRKLGAGPGRQPDVGVSGAPGEVPRLSEMTDNKTVRAQTIAYLIGARPGRPKTRSPRPWKAWASDWEGAADTRPMPSSSPEAEEAARSGPSKRAAHVQAPTQPEPGQVERSRGAPRRTTRQVRAECAVTRRGFR